MSKPPRTRKGMAGVTGIGSALDADMDSIHTERPAPRPAQRTQAPAKAPAEAEAPISPYRGRGRSEGDAPLKTISITIPADLLSDSDLLVHKRKQETSAYNRSALIQEALDEYLKRHG